MTIEDVPGESASEFVARFTDKAHLRELAYGDGYRLAARGAIYRYHVVDSIDLGPHPLRTEGISGFHSTWIDPDLSGRAADIGCGRGQALTLLGGQFAQVVAVDLSSGMLAACAEGPWTKVAGDVEALPFATGAIDLVVANHMLYHAPDIAAACAELRRVLRPGGTLLASTNGHEDKATLYELLAMGASRVTGRPEAPIESPDRRFSLESGSVALGRVFADVAIHRVAGRLHLADANAVEALMEYYRSSDDEWAAVYGIAWPELDAELACVLAQHFDRDGMIDVPIRGGVLVAS